MSEKKEKADDKSFVQKAEENILKTIDSPIQTGDSNDLNDEVMEEYFFLMYHLHMQYSEIAALPVYKRKWLLERFIHQKKMEKEMMEQMRRGSGVVSPDFLKELERTRNG